MSLIVQKFGGTSVADSEKILAAARKAIRTALDGNQVVVVVSAMGKNTDMLIDLARQISDNPPAREMDMLLSTGEQVSVALMAMAIDRLGHQAISLTGAQIGIRTDSTHTKARIRSISTERMRRALDEGRIVIAAGFQGIDEDYNITTLGRGGSDTTAVALAAVLGADACEIHTDVDGVYTTDPRLVPEARMLRQVSYDEMLELASLGAGVMHNRSIIFAKKFGVPIHVRSSFSDIPGTMIVEEPEAPGIPVSGAALVKHEALVTVRGVADRPGVSQKLFSRIADHKITVDMIVQNVGAEGKADISFTVLSDELSRTLEACQEVADELGATGVSHEQDVAKLSVVGLGMAAQTGVAQRMFRALADAGINMLMITTSEIKISVLVSRDRAEEALRVVHRAFELDQPPEGAFVETAASAVAPPAAPRPDPGEAAEIVARLQSMEDLTIGDLSLDESQASVMIHGAPDRPGIAAQIFEAIAAADVFVDMIVQSYGRQGHANLSFTVPAADLKRSLDVVNKLLVQLGCTTVTNRQHVAKLSVSGIGMRSHDDVAIRMFTALAGEQINVDMVNTSEVRVNVIVDGAAGKAGLAALERAFADARR